MSNPPRYGDEFYQPQIDELAKSSGLPSTGPLGGFFGQEAAPRSINEATAKLRAFDDAVRFIDSDGSFTGYTDSYYMVKEAEALLHKYGYCEITEKMHPVDVVANFILHNKYYWGGVLGLAALPVVKVGLEYIKSVKIGEEK